MNDGQFDASRRGARREEELDPLPFSAVKMKYWDVQTDLRALCTQNQNHDQSRPESRQTDWQMASRVIVRPFGVCRGSTHRGSACLCGRSCRPESFAGRAPEPAASTPESPTTCPLCQNYIVNRLSSRGLTLKSLLGASFLFFFLQK